MTNNNFSGNSQFPETVSWGNATNYCAVRTAAESAAGKIPAGWVYRLPTEAEWEYACRAGTTTPLWFGNTIRNDGFEQDAWFNGSQPYPTSLTVSNGIVPVVMTNVASYLPNPFGLYDVYGNVAELCLDVYSEIALGGSTPLPAYPGGSVTNPPPSTSPDQIFNSRAIIRGGGWASAGTACRSAARGNLRAYNLGATVGFRIVLTPVKY